MHEQVQAAPHGSHHVGAVPRIDDVTRDGPHTGHLGDRGVQGSGVTGVHDARPLLRDEGREQRPTETRGKRQ